MRKFDVSEVVFDLDRLGSGTLSRQSALRPVNSAAERAIPFSKALEPLAAIGQRHLSRHCPSSLWEATPLRIGLIVDLYRRLAQRLGQSLYFEFELFRIGRRSRLELLALRHRRDPSFYLYREFASLLTQDGFRTFFTDYSGTRDEVAGAISQWVIASTELLTRIESDWADLRAAGLVSTSTPKVIETGLSDPHGNGRTVVALVSGGGRLYYKPRAMGLEVAFNGLLEWCRAAGLVNVPRAVQVLDRGEYGWALGVRRAPTDSNAAARRYSRRAGVLLCLVQMLQGIDGHNENIVSSGDSPVLVDTECIMHPRFRPELLSDDHGKIQPGTLLATGLIPDASAATSDISGLGLLAGEGVLPGTPVWSGLNTDAMTLRFEDAHRAESPGDAPALQVDRQELIAGYLAASRFLAEQKGALLDDAGPLSAFAGRETRIVVRPTAEYQGLLVQALSASSMRQQKEARALLIPPPKLRSPSSPALAAIAEAEFVALQRRDIPRFTTSTTSEHVDSLASKPACFSSASFTETVERLESHASTDGEAAAEELRALLP